MMPRPVSLVLLAMLVLYAALVPVSAGIKLPAIIGDHMVLQQNQENPVWGWDAPGSAVRVGFAGREITAIAGADGKWQARFDPGAASHEPRAMVIRGTDTVVINDILVGEVWICAGQSNMAFKLEEARDGEIEAALSGLPGLRLASVPQVGSQELKTCFDGRWQPSSPAVAAKFSAIGLIYGRHLREILNVPVGMIDLTWGGSDIEAWLPRESLESDARFSEVIRRTQEAEEKAHIPESDDVFAQRLTAWEREAETARRQARSLPIKPIRGTDWLRGRERAGNIFGGMVHPVLGYGIKGFIWYQGESNAPRAREYQDLFPYLITEYRKEWGRGDFPFYWVQITSFGSSDMEVDKSERAELREAQTRALRLKNTGQAVSIDLGEGKDVHPRNKHDVAMRLLRWALANDYGFKLPFCSPEYKAMRIEGNKVIVAFDCFGGRLRPFGVSEATGFAIRGPDNVWHSALGRILDESTVEVWSESVSDPVSVRYAWADNPTCNLFNDQNLPATPFRADKCKPGAGNSQ
jgi:sialate O-acetylesterase